MTYSIIKQKITIKPKKELWRKTLLFKNGIKVNFISNKENFNFNEKVFLKKFFNIKLDNTLC